jgi:hypothetical protein
MKLKDPLPSLDSILTHLNPIHMLITYSCRIHFSVITNFSGGLFLSAYQLKSLYAFLSLHMSTKFPVHFIVNLLTLIMCIENYIL